MKFDAYLTADTLWASLPRGCPRILMFHGVAGKYADEYDGPTRSMRAWHRLFFINRRRLNNHVAAGAIATGSSAARLVGMPKLDSLVDGSLSRDRVILTLGLDPSRRTVLYAPTWSPYSSLNVCGETIVRRLVDAGYAVIIKLHDRSRHPQYIHSGGVNWAARLAPLVSNGKGYFFTGADASPCLAAADLLITDHSSVGFEYLLLDRPVIRIEVPELLEKTRVAAEYVELLRRASITVNPGSDIVGAVERSLSEPRRESPSRTAVADELFYQPGTATARAVRELYEVLDLEPAALAMRPPTSH
jgi:CDP-glycerol glycerophosphotransferase (TagB/SpsB family)